MVLGILAGIAVKLAGMRLLQSEPVHTAKMPVVAYQT